jgi:hypothetical protein
VLGALSADIAIEEAAQDRVLLRHRDRRVDRAGERLAAVAVGANSAGVTSAVASRSDFMV